ncbi:MAG: UDP-glucose--hexose-1-phosphate uridylyltransferase [Lachnospiraceae bacterium]|nr:UDP-glucose--hexose-1-phosphate uridylyltransferase [Lachnospiraceae bacterium]
MVDINAVYKAVSDLAEYGIVRGLITERDRIYTINRLLAKLKLDHFESSETYDKGRLQEIPALEEILRTLLDYAAEKGLLEDDRVVYRDLFDTELMDCLTPRPGEVAREFARLYEMSPKQATDWYYDLSKATDYIRTYRIAKDIKWTAATEYGELVITINLSKPEKDPKAIAAALSAKQADYPKCQLCCENEGYAGRVNHPARANHRIIPITINNTPWFLQYSPYVYYNEHCIVFNSQHTPMRIDKAAFDKLLDFIRQFPHYMVGSNADLPIVGGSILTHDHFQGGNYEFPMARAEVEEKVSIKGFEDVEAGILKWPMTVLRIASTDPARISDCAERVLKAWREYSDESSFIFAYSRSDTGEAVTDAPVDYEHHGDAYLPHNTITPIARMRNGRYEMDLVLRNNITTDEHPLGVFHPHAEHHHIKKENIGLIEVMGLAILPARLKSEIEGLTDALVKGIDISKDEVLAKHAEWIGMIRQKYGNDGFSDKEKAADILKYEIGLVYSDILQQCGVFKRNEAGRAAFLKFVESV